MTWTYEQSTGNLYRADGSLMASGYAGGDCGHTPKAVNNPEMQNVQMVGPLPVGRYTQGNPFDSPRLGPFAIPLNPDPANEMFGRSGFRMHGDTATMNHSASEGCIIMPRSVRMRFAESGEDLEVVGTAPTSV